MSSFPWQHPVPGRWTDAVYDALDEDLGTGDLGALCLDPAKSVDYIIEVQGKGVICGLGIASDLLHPANADGESKDYLEIYVADGTFVEPGQTVIEGRLNGAYLLSRERVVLNFLMHLSGVATLTRAYVDRVSEFGVEIVDTRKTIPGMRVLQKYAVRCGGGKNHRFGLYDGLMIKDNHIAACGGIGKAVAKARSRVGHMMRIEVECESVEAVKEAVEAGADIVMLDNMNPFEMREVSQLYKGQVVLEASGGISLETVSGVAKTGIDVISVGALTHSAPALALHMEVRG